MTPQALDKDALRPFPTLRDANGKHWSIPYWVAEEAFKVYGGTTGTRYGQSLERIAERGGFSWEELVALLRGEDSWRALGQRALSGMFTRRPR